MDDVTGILSKIEGGDAAAAEELMPLVYDELRRLAARQLATEPAGQTLQPTALVHEAYLRLVHQHDDPPQWRGRRHFFAAAAEAMRRILVENARRKRRLKRGGSLARVDFDENLAIALEVQEDVIALDAALAELAASDQMAAELVKLRYFAGLTMAEAAEILGLAPRSADRMWAYARVWLLRKIAGSQSAGEDS